MTGHVTPLKVYFGVFAALMAFTAITVAVAYVNLGELNKVVAKLSSLRQCPAERPDKMGPWYHIMAVTTAGALSWSAGTAGSCARPSTTPP